MAVGRETILAQGLSVQTGGRASSLEHIGLRHGDWRT